MPFLQKDIKIVDQDEQKEQGEERTKEGSLAAVFFSQRHTINLEEGTNEKRATGELVASRKRMHKTEQKVNWFDKTSKFALCYPLFTVRPSFWPTFPFLAFAGFFLSNTNDKITQNKQVS